MTAARNIVASMRGGRLEPFTFRTIGQLAAIGRRTGVGRVMGVNFSGFLAWWLWRTVYLVRLPRLKKKIRVALDWTLDLVFDKDLVQFTTVRPPDVTVPHSAESATSIESEMAAASPLRRVMEVGR